MVKVYHFDYKLAFEVIKDYQEDLERIFKRYPNIEYRFDGPIDTYNQKFELWKPTFETELVGQDVFLVHPGLEGQRYVINVLPQKFPDLYIGILTFVPEDYKEALGKVEILPCRRDRLEKILEFVQRVEQKKSSGN